MKARHISLLLGAFPYIIVSLIITVVVAGGAGGAANPIEPPCTPETAERYGMVSSELGAPWDIVLLADAYFAQQHGESDIEQVNPIYTALQFIEITELHETWEVVDYEEADPESEESSSTPVYGWAYLEEEIYSGKNSILRYTEISENRLDSLNSSTVISAAERIAFDKCDSENKFTITVSVSSDFERVLQNYIGLNEENTEKVIELYDSKYIPILYFGGTFLFDDYILPPVTVGNVTRQQLAEIAMSIIGHPYYWGGKAYYSGLPTSGLDCSGYIDWVYYQCFGRGVNGGTTPSGIVQNGTAMQFYSCSDISESELKIGDLGFYRRPEDVTDYNHVGIYVGMINGERAFVHCGGSSFGYSPDRTTGRVGISINVSGVQNSVNPLGGNFSPPMKGSNFRYFKRPQFVFVDD